MIKKYQLFEFILKLIIKSINFYQIDMGKAFGKMFGGGEGESKTEIHHHYHQSPELSKRLQQLEGKYKQSVEKLKNMKDPSKAEEMEKMIFMNFLEGLDGLSIYKNLPKKYDMIYNGVMGIISSGKSSLINRVFGTDEKVGFGEVTSEIKMVFMDKQNGIAVWDSPGLHDLVNVTNHEVMRAFYQMDKMFVLYRDSPKMAYKSIMVMNKINPKNTFIIRSQCDLFGSEEEVDNQLEKDKKTLKEWGIELPIYAISMKKDESYRDNRRIYKQFATK